MRGLSTPSENKVVVKRAIVDASHRCILLCDTSKYGKIATYMALPMSVFDTVITDDALPDTAKEAIRLADITLLLAKVES